MGFACIFAAIVVVLLVCLVVGRWKIFVKAGEPGWKAVIPFYSFYTQVKICAPLLLYWIWLGCYIVNFILGLMRVSGVLPGIISLATFVLTVLASLKLSKAFGHGIGFAIGLILLPPIFLLILGFGSSEYDPMIDKESWY